MKILRASWRLCYFAFYTSLRILQIILYSVVLGKDLRRSMSLRQSWARHLLPALGIQIDMRGTPPDFPCILMANHRSYLDPALLVRDNKAYAVSKAEVAKWPIIGFGARVSGVLFLQRESAESRKKTLNGIAEKLQEGYAVFLFPEGTTQSAPGTASFKPGGFKLAATAGFPIVPVALDFESSADHWVGDDTFLPHFIRRFGEKKKRVQISYGAPIWSEDPQELLDKTKSWIDSELQNIHQRWS